MIPETDNMNEFYLHGSCIRADGTEDSFWTKRVEAKRAPMPHHIAGRIYTATGYGSALPSGIMVRFNGRWRRVYVCCYSNSGTAYIKAPRGERIIVREYA